MISISCHTLNELDTIAGKIIDFCSTARILAFYGDLGSGKTTLIQALCRNIGVTDIVTSPTFPIINEYVTADGKNVYHFDFYRVKDSTEVLGLGLEEYFSSGNYCFIEWPAVAEKHLPPVFVEVVVLPKDGMKPEPGFAQNQERIFRLEIKGIH